jgi:hypothetical protein
VGSECARWRGLYKRFDRRGISSVPTNIARTHAWSIDYPSISIDVLLSLHVVKIVEAFVSRSWS